MAGKKRLLSNKGITIMKLVSAFLLFFACCLFFFTDMDRFKTDFGLDQSNPLGSANNPWWNVLFVIVFIFSVSFICYYIAVLIIRIENKECWKPDSLFITYKLFFVAILGIFIWRSFFTNMTNLLLPSIILIFAGLIMLLTPRIIDNDNQDF